MKKGFTLLELLVVIAIIGILAGVIFASLSSARDKARNASVLSDMKTIGTQSALWYATHNNSYLTVPTPGYTVSDDCDSGTAQANSMLGDPAIKQALAQLDSLNGIYPVNCFIHDTPNGVSTYGISLQFPWGFPPGYVPGISPYQEGAWLCIDTDDTLKSAQIQFDGTTIQCR